MSRLAEVLPRRIDLRILFLALALTAIGIAMVVSTTAGTPRGDLAGKQISSPSSASSPPASSSRSTTASCCSTRRAFMGSRSSCLLLLPFVGKQIAGAKSWLRIAGGFQVQPSEFARLSIALLLAWILENDDRALLRSRRSPRSARPSARRSSSSSFSRISASPSRTCPFSPRPLLRRHPDALVGEFSSWAGRSRSAGRGSS